LDNRSPPAARRKRRGAAISTSRSAITPIGIAAGRLSLRVSLVRSTEMGDISPSFDTTVGTTRHGMLKSLLARLATSTTPPPPTPRIKVARISSASAPIRATSSSECESIATVSGARSSPLEMVAANAAECACPVTISTRFAAMPCESSTSGTSRTAPCST